MVFTSFLKLHFLFVAIAIFTCQWWGEATFCVAQVPIDQTDNSGGKVKPSSDNPSRQILKEGTLKDGTLQLDAELYLPDNSDKPILVPNYDLGKFLEFVRQKGDSDEFPKYSFEQVFIEGSVAGNNVEIMGRFRLQLSEKPTEAMSIPLRFESCQLTSLPRFEGSGSSILALSPEGLGYRWWLKADTPGDFTAKLTGQTVVVQDGNQKSIKLALPLAPCHIELRFPKDDVDIEVGGQGNEVHQTRSDEKGLLVSIRGSGGEITVSWRSKDSRRVKNVIEARSRTKFDIEDPTRTPWEANATVTVSWYEPVESGEITLQLPLGSRYVPSPYSSESYSITPKFAATESNANSPVELVVRFRTDEAPLTNSLDIPVHFQWQPPLVDRRPGKTHAIPGIELKDMESHEGTVELVLPSAYSLQWRVGAGSELVQQIRLNDEMERSQYVFRFNRQPLSLSGNFRRESSQPEIRPIYLAEVDRGKIKLTAWLECSFDLTQRPLLGINLGNWVLESADLVPSLAESTAPGVALTQDRQSDGTVLLSHGENVESPPGARRTQQFWRLVAFRKWTTDDTSVLHLKIPEFVRARRDGLAAEMDHGSGVLMVASADNVQLRWNESSSTGLLLDSLSSQLGALLSRDLKNRTTVYRFQSGAESVPNWSGNAEFLPRQISFQQNVHCFVNARTVDVSQVFALQIAYEPLESLRLLLRPDSKDVLVKINDEVATLRLIPGDEQNTSSSTTQRQYEIIGANYLRGKVTVRVDSRVLLPEPDVTLQLIRTAIPFASLVLPDGARPTSQQILIDGSRDVEVLADQTEEQLDIPAQRLSSIVGQTLQLAAEQREIWLQIRQVDRVEDSPVRVTRAWLQTALTGTIRRDRFCALVETSQPKLTLQLPGTKGPLPDVFVDGQSVSLFRISPDRFRFDLPPKPGASPYTLDIWIWSGEGLAWISPINVPIPRVEGAKVVDRFYWQLVSPPHHHLAFVPTQFSSEWRWVWNGLWWIRRSRLNQSELEHWVGVGPQTQLALGTNRYLLSSFGEASGFQAWVVSRLALWLPVGLLAILVTVLLGSIRSLRRPSLLMVVAVLLASGAMVWPDTAVLLGQVALLSIGLVMLMLVVRSTIEMRVRRRSVFTSRASLTVDRSDNFSVGRPIQAPSIAIATRSTATADSGVR